MESQFNLESERNQFGLIAEQRISDIEKFYDEEDEVYEAQAWNEEIVN